MFDPVLLYGAVAAAALVAIATGGWLVVRRGRRGRIAGPDEAAGAADAGLPGFSTTGAVVGMDGGGALAVGADGRVAAIGLTGRRLLAIEIGWHDLRSTAEGMLVDTGDRRLGTLSLAGVDVLDVRRLLPAR